jgi:hypothetical protein
LDNRTEVRKTDVKINLRQREGERERKRERDRTAWYELD